MTYKNALTAEPEVEDVQDPEPKAQIRVTFLHGQVCSACDGWISDKRYKYCPWCRVEFEKANAQR